MSVQSLNKTIVHGSPSERHGAMASFRLWATCHTKKLVTSLLIFTSVLQTSFLKEENKTFWNLNCIVTNNRINTHIWFYFYVSGNQGLNHKK